LTDLAQAELLYVSRCTKVPRMSPLFQSALASLLAYDLASHVTKKADLAKNAWAAFLNNLQRAKVHAANQQVIDQPHTPDFLEGYETVDLPALGVRYGLK
jgi:hypothetical protein